MSQKSIAQNTSNPEYRYPPSFNPYWGMIHSRSKSGTHSNPLPILIDHQTEAHRGTWREFFQVPQNIPLHVELGCNAGHVILPIAKKNPEALFIGVDWKFKVLYRAAEKAVQQKNLCYFRAHSERLPYMFGSNEITSISIFFPDPWEKPSQWKHRFLNSPQLIRLAPLVAPGGLLHIKTDHDEYFNFILNEVAKTEGLWTIQSMTRNLHEKNPTPHLLQIPEVTLFEKIFIKNGIPIKELKLLRSKAPN